jgi:hypothetical protein
MGWQTPETKPWYKIRFRRLPGKKFPGFFEVIFLFSLKHSHQPCSP